MKTFSIDTLGCKVNHAESMAISSSMLAASFQYKSRGLVDVQIVNTCAVTHVAAAKTRKLIHKLVKKNPDALMVVVGCYSELAKEELESISGVNIVVGNEGKSIIPEIIKGYIGRNTKLVNLALNMPVAKRTEFEDMGSTPAYQRTRAFIKVQDGCDKMCSYCAIAHARGRARSRNIESIVAEIAYLKNAGFKEFVLTGIHLASFGLGRGDKEGYRLIDLIEYIATKFPNIRIRLGSLEPKIVDEDFAKRLAAVKEICPHFHLSLQSGSDSVLKKMRRGYTRAEYLRAVDLLKKEFDCPCFTTDIIVGFPEETDDDFLDTMSLCREVGFFEIHIFPFSPREGTAAAKMKNTLTQSAKKSRISALEKIAKDLRAEYIKKSTDFKHEVLVQEVDKEGFGYGFSKSYVPISIENCPVKTNEIVRCRIEYGFERAKGEVVHGLHILQNR